MAKLTGAHLPCRRDSDCFHRCQSCTTCDSLGRKPLYPSGILQLRSLDGRRRAPLSCRQFCRTEETTRISARRASPISTEHTFGRDYERRETKYTALTVMARDEAATHSLTLSRWKPILLACHRSDQKFRLVSVGVCLPLSDEPIIV